jgi:hypothetical protein
MRRRRADTRGHGVPVIGLNRGQTIQADTGQVIGEPAAAATSVAAAAVAAHGTMTAATEGPVAAAVEPQAAARTGRQGASKVVLTNTAAENSLTKEVPEDTPAEEAPAATAPADEAGSAIRRTSSSASRHSQQITDLSDLSHQFYLIFFIVFIGINRIFFSMFSFVRSVYLCTLGKPISFQHLVFVYLYIKKSIKSL